MRHFLEPFLLFVEVEEGGLGVLIGDGGRRMEIGVGGDSSRLIGSPLNKRLKAISSTFALEGSKKGSGVSLESES
ncbi:MAG: hypothetical protein ACI9S8_001667 [Chlamydiales bacterium]|jgi:hypothetical protein